MYVKNNKGPKTDPCGDGDEWDAHWDDQFDEKFHTGFNGKFKKPLT